MTKSTLGLIGVVTLGIAAACSSSKESLPGPGACGRLIRSGAVPGQHRAVAAACDPSPAVTGMADFSQTSCTTDADCAADAGVGAGFDTCLHGHCSRDRCLTDADCASNEVCSCSTYFSDANACLPANCHVDSDCGAGGYCSPSLSPCTSGPGFFCHTPNDTCYDDQDCASCAFGAPACTYSPATRSFGCSSGACGG